MKKFLILTLLFFLLSLSASFARHGDPVNVMPNLTGISCMEELYDRLMDRMKELKDELSEIPCPEKATELRQFMEEETKELKKLIDSKDEHVEKDVSLLYDKLVEYKEAALKDDSVKREHVLLANIEDLIKFIEEKTGKNVTEEKTDENTGKEEVIKEKTE
ncbi:MAG: hypothetical protein ABRQ38_27750 [Candidatus Eremiobacterota bacterium]